VTDDALYFVTDIEATGFWPGRNSMLSFATVAVTATGEEHGRFEAVLAELPDATWHPGTRAWFEHDEPQALAAATTDPREPAEVMSDFAEFVLGLPGPRVFAAAPVSFDGVWIDHYLRRFTPYGLRTGMYEPEGLFDDALCLRSYGAAVLSRSVVRLTAYDYPPEWLGNVPHTHRAIDDALGFAHLLAELFRRSGAVTAR
jgi:hypothetical protein